MYLDPNEDIDIKEGGYLPHWHQNAKIQFVTFRLADSLPSSVVRDLKNTIDTFNKNHPKPWSVEVKQQYWNLVGPLKGRLLDNGYGSCILKHQEAQDILKEIIFNRDGIDYNVIAYVIMPNHVHMLIQPYENITLSKILHSIKGLSALRINSALKRAGKLWMSESFDRIVRSSDSLKHYIHYIQRNPERLAVGQYDLYLRPDFFGA